MELEKEPFVNPIVSAEKQAKLTKELDTTSKRAIDEVIGQKLPMKKLQDIGMDLEEAYTSAYEKANKTANSLGEVNIPLDDLIEFLEKKSLQIEKSSPSLSKQDTIVLNEIKDQINNLTSKSTSKIKKTKPIPKSMTASQSLTQYKNFNKNVKSIYRKPEFTGAENEVKNLYAEMNEELIKSIDKKSPQLANELKFANNIFSEKSKIDQVDNILNKSFNEGYNPNKLAKTLSSRKERTFLERNIGKEGVKDLERIAKYGQKAEEKVFKHLKNPETIKQYLEKMTPFDLMLLVGYKSHIKLPFTLAKGAIQRAQGYLFTRDPTRQSLVKFISEASKMGENPAGLFNAANSLNKSINKEFGSEKELLNLSNQEND
jgi:hypothetical protein